MPMCEISDVSFWLRVHMNNNPSMIDGTTEPGETDGNKAIALSESTMIGRFREAGFVIPLAPIGDSWNQEDLDWLALVCSAGAASILSKASIAPVYEFNTSGDIKKSDSSIGFIYRSSLNQIYDRGIRGPYKHTLKFPAQYYSNTAAYYAMSEVNGPSSSTRWNSTPDIGHSSSLACLVDLIHESNVVIEGMNWSKWYTALVGVGV